MKSILIVTSLGLITGAIYAAGGFSFIKDKLKPVKIKSQDQPVKGSPKDSVTKN